MNTYLCIIKPIVDIHTHNAMIHLSICILTFKYIYPKHPQPSPSIHPCMHAYIHILIHIHIHNTKPHSTYMHSPPHRYINTYIHAKSTQVSIHAQLNSCIHTYICPYPFIHISMCLASHPHIHVSTNSHMHKSLLLNMHEAIQNPPNQTFIHPSTHTSLPFHSHLNTH